MYIYIVCLHFKVEGQLLKVYIRYILYICVQDTGARGYISHEDVRDVMYLHIYMYLYMYTHISIHSCNRYQSEAMGLYLDGMTS